MKKHIYIKKALLTVALLYTVATAFSQNSNLLYYLENVPQVNYTNPAMMPRANSFFSLPGFSSVSLDLKNDIAPKDLLQKSGDIWVTPIDAAFDYDQLYKSIGKSAQTSTSIGYAPLYFGWRTKKGYFTFSWALKAGAFASLPKDLFKITEKGFESSTTLNLTSLETKMMMYHEISIGYAHKVDERLTVGAHIKPISGIAAAQMKYNRLTIKNEQTSYSMNVDGELLTSVPFIEFVPNEDGFPEEINEDDDISGSDISSESVPSFSNFGMAVDLGAVYDLNNKISFSASLNNLGFIKWKKNLNSTTVNGEYTFTGPDLSITETDEIDEAYDDIIDNMKDALNGETAHKSFSTTLSPELFLGSVYHANHVLDMGFIAKSTFAKYNFRQEFVVSANLNLYKALTTNLAYNYEIGGSKDLGLGLALRLGPAQLYILANHIPYQFDKIIDGEDEYIAPTKAESFSFMMGINFIFGKHGYRNDPMIRR